MSIIREQSYNPPLTDKELKQFENDYNYAIKKTNNENITTIYDKLKQKAGNSKFKLALLNGSVKVAKTTKMISFGLIIGALTNIGISAVNGYDNYKDINNQYSGIYQDPFYADEEMKEFAKEITKECKDDDEICKIRKIYTGIKGDLNVQYCKTGTENTCNQDPYFNRVGTKTALEVYKIKDAHNLRYGVCIEQANLHIALARSIKLNSSMIKIERKNKNFNTYKEKLNQILSKNPQKIEELDGHAIILNTLKNGTKLYTDYTYYQKPIIKNIEEYAQNTQYKNQTHNIEEISDKKTIKNQQFTKLSINMTNNNLFQNNFIILGASFTNILSQLYLVKLSKIYKRKIKY
jgi:hypothetical protein